MTATLRPTTAAPTPTPASSAQTPTTVRSMIPYLMIGIVFGIVLFKSEVIFWYRIHEMFLFKSFHMYGVLGSALVTAFLSLHLLRRLGIRARTGDPVALPRKEMADGHRYWIGGGVFGVGWALCGACPGPLFALIGSGVTVYFVTAIAALAGTWTYGVLRPRLPH